MSDISEIEQHLCVLKGNYLGSKDKQNSHVLTFEDMIVYKTGEQQPIETLVKNSIFVDDGDPERTTSKKSTGYMRKKYNAASALREANMSYAGIAIVLGYADKSSTPRLLAKFDALMD